MPRDYGSSRRHLRKIDTCVKGVDAGFQVITNPFASLQVAVRKIARVTGRSERYVWGTLNLARTLFAKAVAILEQSANQRRRPLTVATVFLIGELRNGPKGAVEMEQLARAARISERTLRRACQTWVTKRHVGGSRGRWTWELSEHAKRICGRSIKGGHFPS